MIVFHRLVFLSFALLPYQAPADLAYTLSVAVGYDAERSMYRYEYTLANLPDSTRDIGRFALFVRTDQSTHAVPVPGGWDARYYPMRADYDLIEWPAEDRSFLTLQPNDQTVLVLESSLPPVTASYMVEHINPKDREDGEPAAQGYVVAPTPTPGTTAD